MDFLHGTWTGSIVAPRLAGNLKATQVSLEMLPLQGAANTAPQRAATPQFVHWDSVEATGSYAPEKIAIQTSLLRRGQALLSVDGTLDAAPSTPRA